MDPVVLFFLLGVVARLLKSDLRLPEAMYEGLSIFLLLAIGLKGGVKLAEQSTWDLYIADVSVLRPEKFCRGYVTGIVVSTGPINTPFFLAYGLVKGRFLATEALGSISVYLAKGWVFHAMGALPWSILGKGLIVGSSVMLGSYLGKRIVQRLEIAQFQLLMDAVLVLAGGTMLFTAVQG